MTVFYSIGRMLRSKKSENSGEKIEGCERIGKEV